LPVLRKDKAKDKAHQKEKSEVTGGERRNCGIHSSMQLTAKNLIPRAPAVARPAKLGHRMPVQLLAATTNEGLQPDKYTLLDMPVSSNGTLSLI
jgi:hypothetical protein